MAGREMWAALQLLDRQLVDPNERLCGMVDDVELAMSDDTGELYVTALLSGPGALATRLGARRLGSWLRRVTAVLSDGDHDPVRIPLRSVADIGAHVRLSIGADETATAALEHWARRHVIAHIPGSRHEPE